MILIVGASSTVGKATIPLLRSAGYKLRLSTRQPEKLADFAGEDVEIVQADLLDEDSMRKACEGVDKVFATVASFLGRGKNAAQHVDYEGQCRLIDIAKEAGVKHFVYMSTQEATPDNPIPFFRYKALTEAYLKASGLNYTILRASAFFEPHLALIGDGVLKGGKAMIMGSGENPRNFIANADAAQFAKIALTTSDMLNQSIDIGGPDNLTSQEVAELYARIKGIELQTQRIPRFVPQIMTVLFKPFHPGLSDMMGAVVDSDTRSKYFDASGTLDKYKVSPTYIEDWIQAQISA